MSFAETKVVRLPVAVQLSLKVGLLNYATTTQPELGVESVTFSFTISTGGIELIKVAGITIVGGVVSMIMIVWVNKILVFPQLSVTVHVFVYVPVEVQVIELGTNTPAILIIFVTSVSQRSEAVGNNA